MSVQRRRYDPYFKRNVGQLTEERGRSVKDVADNLGISKDLLYKWRRELRAKEKLAFPGNGREALTEQEKKIRDLEKSLRTLRWKEISKKSCGHLQQSTEMKYKFIGGNRSTFPVTKMCQDLGVTLSGFYRWEKAPISKRKQENIRIKERVKESFIAHKGMVGAPVVTADLRDEHEFSKVSRPRVARFMLEMGLRCKTTKKFVVTTDSKHSKPVAPNLLNRNFNVSAPNTVWVSDITSRNHVTKTSNSEQENEFAYCKVVVVLSC